MNPDTLIHTALIVTANFTLHYSQFHTAAWYTLRLIVTGISSHLLHGEMQIDNVMPTHAAQQRSCSEIMLVA